MNVAQPMRFDRPAQAMTAALVVCAAVLAYRLSEHPHPSVAPADWTHWQREVSHPVPMAPAVFAPRAPSPMSSIATSTPRRVIDLRSAGTPGVPPEDSDAIDRPATSSPMGEPQSSATRAPTDHPAGTQGSAPEQALTGVAAPPPTDR